MLQSNIFAVNLDIYWVGDTCLGLKDYQRSCTVSTWFIAWTSTYILLGLLVASDRSPTLGLRKKKKRKECIISYNRKVQE